MPENGKQTLKARTSSHSDVAATPAAKEFQAAQTERQFGATVVRHLRDTKVPVRLRNFQEEWVSTDDGLVHELSVESELAE
jgi:hypothetical protein